MDQPFLEETARRAIPEDSGVAVEWLMGRFSFLLLIALKRSPMDVDTVHRRAWGFVDARFETAVVISRGASVRFVPQEGGRGQWVQSLSAIDLGVVLGSPHQHRVADEELGVVARPQTSSVTLGSNIVSSSRFSIDRLVLR